MADNVAITAGSGTSIATDDVSGVHYQKIKVYASTDGTESPLTRAEDAAHSDGDHGVLLLAVRNYAGAGSDGDYSALSTTQDGSLRVAMHKDQLRIAVQSSSFAGGASYVAGDQVGTLFTLANAARASGGSGVITSVLLTNANDIIGAYEVVFFRASVTLATDSSPFSISAADTRSVVASIPLTSAIDLGSGRVAQAINIAVPYDCSGGTSLYAALICRSAHAVFGAGTDLELVVTVELN